MFFFEKRGTKNFATPYLMSVPYLGVLPKNKSLYNFSQKGAACDCWMHKRSRFESGDKSLL